MQAYTNMAVKFHIPGMWVA